MIHVVAGLVVHGGRLLISRRLPEAHQGGCWEFPGGKVEPGESEPEALRRELREELGIEVEVGPLFDRVRHTYPGREPLELAFYVCRAGHVEPRALGCSAFAWVLPCELRRYTFPAANEGVAARLAALRGFTPCAG